MTIEQLGIILGVAVLIGGVVVYLLRQRGGEGPVVTENTPRFARPWVNAWHGLNNWPIPFTREGEFIAVEERRRAKE